MIGVDGGQTGLLGPGGFAMVQNGFENGPKDGCVGVSARNVTLG